MSIQIRNTGGDKETSIRRYEISVNGTLITYFTHDRNLGLALCLEKAAQAVSMRDTVKMFDSSWVK